jgi:hypothetical protein
MLVALFSVSATLLTVAVPLLIPDRSKIRLVLESGSDTGFTFIARNTGHAGGVLELSTFWMGGGPKRASSTWFLEKNKTFLKPTEEKEVDVVALSSVCEGASSTMDLEELGPRGEKLRQKFAPKLTMENLHSTLAGLLLPYKCGFSGVERSYGATSEIEFPVPCSEIPPVIACVQAKVLPAAMDSAFEKN